MDFKRIVYKIKKKLINKKYNLNQGDLSEFIKLRDGIEVYKDKIENLFLGSSNGDYGVNTNMFDANKAFNLCIASQDLYYSFQLYKKYAEELKNLKNIFVTYSVFSAGFELQRTSNNSHIYYYKNVFEIPYKYETAWGGVKT